MPPLARDSEFPVVVVAEPRAKTLGKYPVAVFARKPAIAKREPERLAREQKMATALAFTMKILGLSDSDVGAYFGVCATSVRAMRRREKVVQIEKLYRCATPEAEQFRQTLLEAFRAALLDNQSANDT